MIRIDKCFSFPLAPVTIEKVDDIFIVDSRSRATYGLLCAVDDEEEVEYMWNNAKQRVQDG